MTWLKDIFKVTKPVIGMCHLASLPGDPGYNEKAGMADVVARARRELHSLQDGGVDGVLFSNEFSLPYLTKTEPITSIAMARVIAELYGDLQVPHGVNVLWDGKASIELAAATDATFVREIFTGAYASDFGIWDTDVGSIARHRRRLNSEGVRLLFNIVPEGAAYLSDRRIEDITRSTIFNAHPDGICVSGLTAGSATDFGVLSRVKSAASATPVFVNPGVTAENVEEQLAVADGAIVGTFFKHGGVFEEPVDPNRVSELMTRVVDLRGSL